MSLNYRILYPKKFKASQQYPVILFLHGSGERGNDNQKQLVHGSKLFLKRKIMRKYPAVVIFPQCPEEDYWSTVNIDRTTSPFTLEFDNVGEPTNAMAMVIALMDSVVNLDYALDSQIYVGGLSMGGMGTFEILSRRPAMFAAGFPICGGGSPESAALYGKHTAMWVFHGAMDNVVHPSLSTAMVLALQKTGGEVRYTLYPKANHNSWDSAFSEKELLPWLFSHQKNEIR